MDEGRLLGKQAEVGGEVYGGGESGRKVKAPRIQMSSGCKLPSSPLIPPKFSLHSIQQLS